jgi:hypothetical protein
VLEVEAINMLTFLLVYVALALLAAIVVFAACVAGQGMRPRFPQDRVKAFDTPMSKRMVQSVR